MARTTTKTPEKQTGNEAAKSAGNLTLVKGSKALILANGKTKANVAKMREAAELLGVDVPTTRGPKADQELLGNLRVEVGKRLAELDIQEHIGCEKCGEVATSHTDFCPYCGDAGQEVGVPPAPAEVDEPDEETPDESDDDAGEESDKPEDEPEEESDEEESDEDSDEPSVGIAAKAAPLAKNVNTAMVAQALELDQKVAEIVELRKSAVGLTYDIGLVCKDIRDRQLFKARGYKSFTKFAETELPFTRESALQMVAIVEKHNRGEFEKIGYAKMRLIAAVNDNGLKEELMEAAKKGAPTREIAARANGSSLPVPKKTERATPAPEKGERITLLGKIGAKSQVVKFRSADGSSCPAAGTFNAKSLVSNAYGELEISDGVFIHVGLRLSAQNELVGLTVRFVRSADDE